MKFWCVRPPPPKSTDETIAYEVICSFAPTPPVATPPPVFNPSRSAAAGIKKFCPPESKMSVACFPSSVTGTTRWPGMPSTSLTNGTDAGAESSPVDT